MPVFATNVEEESREARHAAYDDGAAVFNHAGWDLVDVRSLISARYVRPDADLGDDPSQVHVGEQRDADNDTDGSNCACPFDCQSWFHV